jgi:hypothetical protein
MIMNTRKMLAALRAVSAALVATVFVASCGGGSDTTAQPDTGTPPPATGMVGLWFTDLPTDDFSSITLKVSEAILIGEDDSHEQLFAGERFIDLLDLTNYSEPVFFGEVKVGTYKKIRLMIDSIELVPVGGGDSIFAKVPANGKVDLLQPDGFDVLPGRTVMIEIDVDANKAIKITGAGKSGKVNFRPVVRVNVYDAGMPHKLARLEGAVSGEPDGTNGTFVLCSIDAPDHCVDVATNGMTSFFDVEGLGTDFSGLSDGAMVVVIGEYSSDPIVMNALIVEIGGNAEQVTGDVVSEPADSQFLVLTIGGEDFVVELQPGTKYFDASGPIGADAIVLGATVEVEGVIPAKADPEDPDVIRAAMVFLEAPDAEQLSGTIAAGTLDADAMTFDLTVDGNPVCVRAMDADVLLVDTENSVVMPGTFADLADDQVVDLFGETAEDMCFDASEVIVDVDASAPPAT